MRKVKEWAYENLKGDSIIWLIILLLSIFSVLVVYSATGSLAYKYVGGNTEYYLLKHSALVFLSLFAMWVAITGLTVDALEPCWWKTSRIDWIHNYPDGLKICEENYLPWCMSSEQIEACLWPWSEDDLDDEHRALFNAKRDELEEVRV